VVVAIDPLWLLNALESHYGSMLSDAEDQETRARALDYLDKIFQIPYVVTAPADRAMGEYLRTLLVVETAEGTPTAAEAANVAIADLVTVSEEQQRPRPGQAAETAAPTADAAPERHEPTRPAPSPASTAPPNLRPGGLLLRPAESDFMARLAPLVGTPRAGKKLANLYRLMRIRLPESELRGFIAGEDYRRVQILLAILVGSPAVAPAVFASIRAAGSGGVLIEAVRGGGPGAGDAPNPAREQVADRLERIFGSLQDEPVHVAAFQPWCARLERYSFHTL